MTERLERIVPPPQTPLEVPTATEWAAYEEKLGVALPAGYRALLNRYGTCGFDEFIWIFSPKAKNKYFNLFGQGLDMLAGVKEIRDQWGSDAVPYRLFPELGGLLPFGYTANGDLLFWKTLGSAERWTIVVNGTRSDDYEEFRTNLVDFLAGILSKNLYCWLFPDDFPRDTPSFDLPQYLRESPLP
jgi:hypothetical protein